MATAYFPMNQSPATTRGRELLDDLETVNQAFSRLELHRAAIIQEKDGNAGDATDYVTPAVVYGFTSSTVAKNGFAELDSFISNCSAALKQCCAKFRQ